MPASFIVTDPANNVIPGTLEFVDGNTKVIFTPTGVYPNASNMQLKLTTAIKGANGVNLLSDFFLHFTTKAAEAAPEVVLTVPDNNQTNINTNQILSVTFDKEIDPTTVTLA